MNENNAPAVMLRGMSTLRFQAADLPAAARWYTTLLGCAPYFERPGYVEFRLGDDQHELGIVDARFVQQLGSKGAGQSSGAVVYWHVDDVHAALQRVVTLGATLLEPLREFGPGFVAGSVADPFGNILGLMHNAHYLEMHARRSS